MTESAASLGAQSSTLLPNADGTNDNHHHAGAPVGTSKRKVAFIGLGVAAILAIALGVGLGIGLNKNKGSDNDWNQIDLAKLNLPDLDLVKGPEGEFPPGIAFSFLLYDDRA